MKLDILVPWTRQAEDIVLLYLLKSPGGLWSVKDSPEDPEKNHKGFSSPSLEHGLISAGCSDILAITRLSLSIGLLCGYFQCLSERLKEQFIQITRGDGSHIPSLPMVPTIQQNLL